MTSESTKTVAFVVWMIAVSVAGIASGIASVPQWFLVAFVAVVPPLVVRNFWHAPERTMSERIRDARR